MKSLQKISRVKLKVKQNINFVLFGIVSSEPDYKLSLELNKKFLISLKHISPIKLTDKNGHHLPFSRFSYTDTSSELIYSLISNRNGKHFFINNLKNIDFLFQVQNPENEENINLMTSDLREIEIITAIFNLSINKIKDKNLQYLSQ
jgi:hypothetical protein